MKFQIGVDNKFQIIHKGFAIFSSEPWGIHISWLESSFQILGLAIQGLYDIFCFQRPEKRK